MFFLHTVLCCSSAHMLPILLLIQILETSTVFSDSSRNLLTRNQSVRNLTHTTTAQYTPVIYSEYVGGDS